MGTVIDLNPFEEMLKDEAILKLIRDEVQEVGVKEVAFALEMKPQYLHDCLNYNNKQAKLGAVHLIKFAILFKKFGWLVPALQKAGYQLAVIDGDTSKESKEYLYATATSLFGSFLQIVSNVSGKVSPSDIANAGLALRKSLRMVEKAYLEGQGIAKTACVIGKELSGSALKKGAELTNDAYKKGKVVLSEKRKEFMQSREEKRKAGV